MLKRLLLLAVLLLAVPAQAQQQAVETALETAPKGTRFGLLVVDEAGREVVAIAADQRFIPASNTKLFTTAAAYALLRGIDRPDREAGTQVFLVANGEALDVVLYGRGDARMSSAPDCTVDCLATLADAVAVKTRTVRDVIGDDSYYPDQRWSPGMSWNNLGTNEATAASALSLDGNELTVRVRPGAEWTRPVVEAPAYVTLVNEARTAADEATGLGLDHTPNSREFKLYGEIASGTGEWRQQIGIDDPADYAAFKFAEMLRARGVVIKGKVAPRHRIWRGALGAAYAAAIVAELSKPLATLVPPPLAEDVKIINKLSDNHRAEMLLRRIGQEADASLAMEKALFERIGIPRHGYDLSDGSGMSTYNRLSPRATVALLRWAATQPWGEQWYASLPIAGVDGTLKRRFVGTPLVGNLAAKTGTLNATNALSGRFRANSGRMLIFAFFANDVPDGTSATAAMEAALLAIASAN